MHYNLVENKILILFNNGKKLKIIYIFFSPSI